MKEVSAKKVELFDTSLRDGMQQPNIEISVGNAVGLLHRMAAFGFAMLRSVLPAPINLRRI